MGSTTDVTIKHDRCPVIVVLRGFLQNFETNIEFWFNFVL